MDPCTLATRNTVEVVTEEELKSLLNKPEKQVYAGYEPSGEIHLGHLVTVNKLIDLKAAGFDVVVLLADLHAFLNRKGTMDEVRKLADYNKRCFEGLGLKDVKFVLGSDLQLNPDYELLMLRLSQQITLNRATRSMDEVGRQMDAPTVSQIDIPDHADGGYRNARCGCCSRGNRPAENPHACEGTPGQCWVYCTGLHPHTDSERS